jgi:hypothetical protein
VGISGGGGGGLYGGGGGGGYGGGGGGGFGNGGGGGSSYTIGNGGTSAPSTRTGDGQVTITYDPATDTCPVGEEPPATPGGVAPGTITPTASPANVTSGQPRFTG